MSSSDALLVGELCSLEWGPVLPFHSHMPCKANRRALATQLQRGSRACSRTESIIQSLATVGWETEVIQSVARRTEALCRTCMMRISFRTLSGRSLSSPRSRVIGDSIPADTCIMRPRI
jgi:hypothetical protein